MSRIRTQYHFRPSEQGLQAWNVRRLIQRCHGLPTERLALSAIRELDEPYWYGAEGEVPTARSIAEHMKLVLSVSLAYPIIVCPEGRLLDGMHRCVKALLEGHEHILAYRLLALPPPDHIGLGPDELPYGD